MIEVTLKGRMGNNLFQYAVCRSVAEKNGYDWFIHEKDWLGKSLFNVSFGGRGGADITREFIEGEHRYHPEVWDIEDGTRLVGYFQSEKYFDHMKVRKWFKLWPDIDAEIFIEHHPLDEYCYINLRGTDVKELGCQKLSRDYYTQAIEIMKIMKPDIKFVVVTDDIPFGQEYFPEYEVTSNTVRMDFTLLNRAKWVILANSTFSWWAAWLNQNNFVIAPQGWLNVNINKWETIPHDIKVNRWNWI